MQRGLELAGALRLLILPRADAGNLLEHPLKIKRAHAHVAGDRVQAQRGLEILIDEAASGFDLLQLQAAFAGSAAAASAIAGLLGLVGRVKELYQFRPRTPAGARGTAENAGGFDGVDKLAVGVNVAREDQSPFFLIGVVKSLHFVSPQPV